MADPAPAVELRNAEIGETEWISARKHLCRIALALGVRAEDVPDVVQETFLVAHRARNRFDPQRGAFDAWLASILVGRARNRLRAAWRWRRLVAALRAIPFAGRRNGDASLAGLEARLVVERLLKSLTDSQREVVALYEIAEMSADEAARLLGISAAGVRSIARDARCRLARVARASHGRKEA